MIIELGTVSEMTQNIEPLGGADFAVHQFHV
jgi:hypothetical protein